MRRVGGGVLSSRESGEAVICAVVDNGLVFLFSLIVSCWEALFLSID